jgi:hypothetical protein
VLSLGAAGPPAHVRPLVEHLTDPDRRPTDGARDPEHN